MSFVFLVAGSKFSILFYGGLVREIRGIRERWVKDYEKGDKSPTLPFDSPCSLRATLGVQGIKGNLEEVRGWLREDKGC